MTTQQPPIFITDLDHQRLSSLLSQVDDDTALALEDELGRAHIIAQADIPKDIVTMNSTVQFLDLSSEQKTTVTLVYPQDANADDNKISILAPVGAALLGLSIGQTIDWKMPNGQTKQLKVTDVIYQPEAAGKLNR